MRLYQVYLLKDPGQPNASALVNFTQGSLNLILKDRGYTCFGVFQGLFGLASNELYLVISTEDETMDVSQNVLAEGYEIRQRLELVPTVRPTHHEPREQPGIYVFRWFTVRLDDVTEIASLSAEAWKTFEGGFDTEVQALFVEQHPDPERGKMLLITWYRDLSVWQASRQPPAEALENFMKRQALTLEAFPVATRLAI